MYRTKFFFENICSSKNTSVSLYLDMNIGYLNIGTLEHVFADNRRQVCQFIYKNLRPTLS